MNNFIFANLTLIDTFLQITRIFFLCICSLERDMEQAKLIGDAFARSELDEVKRLYKAAMAESRQNMYSSYANSGVAFVISLLTLAPVS